MLTLKFLVIFAMAKFVAFPLVTKIMLGVALYLLSARYIGLPLIARPSWRIWKQAKKPSFTSFLLFPLSSLVDGVGVSTRDLPSPPFVHDCTDEDERAYLTLVAALWPLKVAVNFALFFVAALVVLAFLVYCFFENIVGPAFMLVFRALEYIILPPSARK